MGKQRRQETKRQTAASGWDAKNVIGWVERHCGAIVVALVLVATARIAATYSVFNHTSDEPVHVACGLEWLDHGVYRWEPQHPPLARVAAAIGPYLFGAHSRPSAGTREQRDNEMWREGLDILYRDHQYERNLTAARVGILPFFWLACWVVFAWSRRFCGKAGAVASVFLFSFTPTVLAHAGVATTDMALAAFLGAAFLTGLMWLEEPTVRRAVWFGLAVAGGIASKFSFLAFFPVSAVLAAGCYWAARRPSAAELVKFARSRAATLGIAVAVACVAVWGCYRFSVGKPEYAQVTLPAPQLFQGVQDVKTHNEEGHPAFLLGTRSRTGFLMFFPVALGVKTPMAFLILLAAGMALAARKQLVDGAWLPLAFAAGILGVGLLSRINIGLRHILPIYIGFSMVAAAAVLRLLAMAEERRWLRIGLPLVLAWFAVSSAISHPDYLAYFNELAGDHPENILVDSDLDWGQDMNRLGERLRRAGAEWVSFLPFVMADLQKEHGYPLVLSSNVPEPSPGWNAVSVTVWKRSRMRLYETHPEVVPWPDKYRPQERVGKSILLYYVPPGELRPEVLRGK